MFADATLDELIHLSRDLGRPERQLVILGEGNTSANCGDETFWVKASGSHLEHADAADFSRVRLAAVTELLEMRQLSDTEVTAGLQRALVDGGQRRPSIETFMHALCLTVGGARWVGHTHPVSVNQILCSRLGADPFLHHVFPDAVVVCGRTPAVIPYADPGMPLAWAVRDELRRYREQHSAGPRMLLMVNHGLTALGQSPRDVLNVTLMADKWARILQGTYAAGGPQHLPDHAVDRIDRRLDEEYRRQQLASN